MRTAFRVLADGLSGSFVISRAGLADRADVHLRHLQEIEAGEVNVTLDTIARLARGLGVSSYQLLAEAPRGRRQ